MSRNAGRSTGLSEFGKTIEKWRKKEGLSQRVLAEMIGTEQRTYSDWIRVGGLPQAIWPLLRLAALVGTELEALVSTEEALGDLDDARVVEEVLKRVAKPGVLQRLLSRLPPSDLGRLDTPGDS